MREKDIERKLREAVIKAGGVCYKFVSPGNNGVPDRVIILNGVVLFAEIKAPGKKPSIIQEIRIREMRNRGAWVEVIDSIEFVNYIIEKILKCRVYLKD